MHRTIGIELLVFEGLFISPVKSFIFMILSTADGLAAPELNDSFVREGVWPEGLVLVETVAADAYDMHPVYCRDRVLENIPSSIRGASHTHPVILELLILRSPWLHL